MTRVDGLPPPTSMTVDDMEAVIALVVTQQARPERNIPSLGTDRNGVIAELGDFDPAWAETVRLVRSGDGAPLGASLVDWSLTAGRAWIHGPWIEDEDRWQPIADVLLDAAIDQLPTEITSAVLASHIAHVDMADLAARRGWSAAEINHVLVVGPAVVDGWPTGDPSNRLRDMTRAEVPAVEGLHNTEFPATYFSVGELFDRSCRGEHVVIVANARSGSIDGYVAGRVQPDGDGYIDFIAVAPNAQRGGIGRALTTAIVRRLLPTSRDGRIYLTVRDDRAAARALYASLGFSIESSIAAYRSERAAW